MDPDLQPKTPPADPAKRLLQTVAPTKRLSQPDETTPAQQLLVDRQKAQIDTLQAQVVALLKERQVFMLNRCGHSPSALTCDEGGGAHLLDPCQSFIPIGNHK